MLMLFFTTWFFIPLLRIIVADAVHPWARDVFILSIELTWDTMTFLLMMGMMWPKCAAKFFDLSTKDTQNRILDSSRDDKSNFQTLEDVMRVEEEMDDMNESHQKSGRPKKAFEKLGQEEEGL